MSEVETTQRQLACQRIRHYVEMRDTKNLPQYGDCIHGIGLGSSWRAELLLSDLRYVLEMLP